jgi:hypothetical protein
MAVKIQKMCHLFFKNFQIFEIDSLKPINFEGWHIFKKLMAHFFLVFTAIFNNRSFFRNLNPQKFS